MTLSDKGPSHRSPAQVPADATDIFAAFRAARVEGTLAYTATERIRELVKERSNEAARLLKKELTERIDSLALEVRTGFAAFEKRFETTDNRLDRVDRRLDGVEGRLGRVEVGVARLQEQHESTEKRFDSIDKRFDSMEKRFDSMEKRFDSMDQRFDSMDQRFGSMASKMDHRFELMASMMEKRLSSMMLMLQLGAAIVCAVFVVGGTVLTMFIQQALQQDRVSVHPPGGTPIGVESSVREGASAEESATRPRDTAGDDRDVFVEQDPE